jgi:hypothetical protein
LLGATQLVHGQCVNPNPFGTVAAPTNAIPLTISTCTFQDEYNTITAVVAGRTYTIGSSCGGYITVRHTTPGGVVVAQGNTPLTFVATVAGTYYIHYTTNAACGTASICCTTTITCSSCTTTPPPGACTAVNIPALPVTGQAVVCHSADLINALNVASICGTAGTNYLAGNEALYTVTPTTTGSYTINYNGQSWSSIWVFSGACPAAGGLCQGSVSGTGTAQNLTVTMTAGVQYWILFDTWPAPPSPCPGTFSITNVPPPVVASDCAQAANVCTNINFLIDPNGFGTVNEIPALGSFGNPDYLTDGIPSPWGTDNFGCLRSGELNSTWMIVNVLTAGTLAFTFGGLGTQTGFYDWIMYPYNATACAQVAANQVAPVRCNWNGVAFGGTGLAATLPPGGDPSNFEPPLNVAALTQWLICFSNFSSVTTAVPLQFGGTATVSCTPLPVELISFEATPNDDHVLLEWLTNSESGTSHFAIERTPDGTTWSMLFEHPATGSSTQAVHYSAADPAPLNGLSYYRLRIIDHDGSHAYSPVRSVTHRSALAVVPNPANGMFTVLEVPDGAAVQLLDGLGRAVPIRTVVNAATNTVVVDPLGATPGVYTVRVFGSSHPVSARLLLER